MTLTQDIRIDGVGKDFYTKGNLFTALENVEITLPIGGFTTLIGPSGCGKSTLLRVVSDILDPDRGSVELFGMTPSQARKDGAFGFVFQDPVLLPWRSAVKNVELPLEAAGVPKKERRERALEMLHLVGLDGFEDNLPAKLSGGMARRVAIARALVMSPRILFLDEPFAGLDEFRRREMNDELQRIWSMSDTTAILVTHNVGEAVFMSDQIVVMGRDPGRVIAQRTIDLERPRTLEITRSREYIAYEEEITELLSAAYRGAED